MRTGKGHHGFKNKNNGNKKSNDVVTRYAKGHWADVGHSRPKLSARCVLLNVLDGLLTIEAALALQLLSPSWGGFLKCTARLWQHFQKTC